MKYIINGLKILHGWIAFILFASFYLILISPLQICLILFCPFKKFKYNAVHILNVIASYVLHLFALVPVKRKYCEKFIDYPPFVVVANHNNYLDISALQIALRHLQLRFIGKKELVKLPVWGFMFKKTHIVVDRKDPESRKAALLKSRILLEQGRSVVVFAEGTTRKPDDVLMLPFRDGAFILSQRTKRPVLPVAILGTRNIVDIKTLKLNIRTIKILIHKPVYPENFRTIEEFKQHVYNIILKTLQENECK